MYGFVIITQIPIYFTLRLSLALASERSNIDTTIKNKIDSYPAAAKQRFVDLYRIIQDLAQEIGVEPVIEALKWDEPSFSVESGIPIRIDWKAKAPHVLSIYVHCQTSLISTCRELYPDILVFEGNRAIILPLDKPWPNDAIRHCLSLAMNYKRIKHLPLLGA